MDLLLGNQTGSEEVQTAENALASNYDDFGVSSTADEVTPQIAEVQELKSVVEIDQDTKCLSGFHSVTTSIQKYHFKKVTVCVKGPVVCEQGTRKKIFKKCEENNCHWVAECVYNDA